MNSETAGLLAFLKQSPTAFHAVQAAEKLLDGFVHLSEHEPWNLVPGGKYYVTRNRSAIIAFTMPRHNLKAFSLVASHTDSPTFKIKENGEWSVRDRYTRLDTEPYGGAIMNTWLDRPLSIAGRVMVRTDKGIETRLVDIDRDLVVIPNVAIHMNREVNSGVKVNPASDTMPLLGDMSAKGSYRKLIAEAAGAAEKDIIGTDLFLYNRMPGTVWGANEEYVSAGRLDDLECGYASLRAFISADAPLNHANVCCLMDNEEVGSTTKQGADATFLQDVLRRMVLENGGREQDYLMALASSFMLSADNAHATHPNHPEYADAMNQVWMNEGVVIKFNANQKYATDAVSQAMFRAVCEGAGVPVQFFANRSDLRGGSTLGNISGSHVSVNTVDIGLAQLAMHSSWETAGVKDIEYMINAMRAFWNADIAMTEDGAYLIS